MGADQAFRQSSIGARAPSRLSNCAGEMVPESVLRQLEEELMVEEDMSGADHTESLVESPGGRTLLVGMKLDATSREMLAWTIIELAKPGDQIVAFHVSSSFPLRDSARSWVYEEHFKYLTSTLRGYLAIYEGICTLKQIKLGVEIVPGVDVKKALVEFAKSHRPTCKLILGSTKHFDARRSMALGMYCLKRLPCTCSVAVLQRGEVILHEKGSLTQTDLVTSIGAGVFKTLRRGMMSFGRSRKVIMSGGGLEEWFDDAPRSPSRAAAAMKLANHGGLACIGYVDHSAELEKCYFSDSSLFHSSLFQELTTSSRMSSPARVDEVERADMFMLEENQNHDIAEMGEFSSRPAMALVSSPGYVESVDFETPKSSVDLIPLGWPLMHQKIGGASPIKLDCPTLDNSTKRFLAPSATLHRRSVEKAKPRSKYSIFPKLFSLEKESKTPPRSPQRRKSFSDVDVTMIPSQVSFDRQMSVVDWALQLPHRNKDFSERLLSEEDYANILGEIARDAFGSSNDENMKKGSGELSADQASSDGANKMVKLVLEDEPKAREGSCTLGLLLGGRISLAHRLDTLCMNRKCVAFEYEDLEAATSAFASCNVVGCGGGSKVYKGMLPDGKLVAVKRLNVGPQAEEELLNDVGINTSLSHPHIVALRGYCVGPSHLILVYDYLPEGNLELRLHTSGTRAPALPWRVRYNAAVGIAKALDYLHHGTGRPVIHRDVKASNILFTANFESQLSDFGLAKWAPGKASHILCDDILGTFGYLAPEYFMYGRVNNKTDVYAFGVVLLELITGRIPIDNARPKGHENLVLWARPLLKENDLEELADPRLMGVYDTDQMNRLLQAASLCVRQSPQQRPPMSRVLQILCRSHRKLQSMRTRPEETEESVSAEDFEDWDSSSISQETPRFGGCGSDIQTHLSLALQEVDDNTMLSKSSSLDLTGVDLLHSSKYPQAYLESRFSPSSQLVK